MFQCPSDTFKCPDMYCVKLRYLCDGQWDCPNGYDEQKCQSINRPGYFKCKNSSIFIARKSICDMVTDCPLLDDEWFCDLKPILCPLSCTCLLYVASCSGSAGWPWDEVRVGLPWCPDSCQDLLITSNE